MRQRLLVASLVGAIAGIVCSWYHYQTPTASNDVIWAIRLLPELVAGRDPYGYATSVEPMSYPLTAGIVTLPFAIFPPIIAGGLFFGCSSALLAFGLTRNGEWWRLMTFLSYPYWMALHTVQWSPLLLAIAFLPTLLPVTLAKPHIGLPIALTQLTPRRALACGAFAVVSLLLLPDWPMRWVSHQAALFRYMSPLVTLPFGPLLLLALWCWRDQRARFLVLLAAVPQHRWGYDTLLLWFLPASPREGLILLGASWLGAIALVIGTMLGGVAWGSAVAVAVWYLPSLIIVLYPHIIIRAMMRRSVA